MLLTNVEFWAYSLLHTRHAAGGGLEVWHPVVLASLPSQCLDIPAHREPREVYLETLFAPEFFCPATLSKGICNMLSGSFAHAEVPVWRSCRVAREIPHKLPHFSQARTLALDRVFVFPTPYLSEMLNNPYHRILGFRQIWLYDWATSASVNAIHAVCSQANNHEAKFRSLWVIFSPSTSLWTKRNRVWQSTFLRQIRHIPSLIRNHWAIIRP